MNLNSILYQQLGGLQNGYGDNSSYYQRGAGDFYDYVSNNLRNSQAGGYLWSCGPGIMGGKGGGSMVPYIQNSPFSEFQITRLNYLMDANKTKREITENKPFVGGSIEKIRWYFRDVRQRINQRFECLSKGVFRNIGEIDRTINEGIN